LAYDDARKKNIVPNFETFCNLISLTAGLGEQGSSSGPPRTVEPPSDIISALRLFDDMKSLGHNIPESAYTALIRCCSVSDQPLKALAFLEEMQEKGLKPKMRTFSHLLEVLSKNGFDDACFNLFEEITKRYSLTPTESDYFNILSLCQQKFRFDLFLTYLQNMMEDILIFSTCQRWSAIQDWFKSLCSDCIIVEEDVNDYGKIHTNSGRHYQLRSVGLAANEKSQLLKQIDSIALLRQIDTLHRTNVEPDRKDIIEENTCTDTDGCRSIDVDAVVQEKDIPSASVTSNGVAMEMLHHDADGSISTEFSTSAPAPSPNLPSASDALVPNIEVSDGLITSSHTASPTLPPQSVWAMFLEWLNGKGKQSRDSMFDNGGSAYSWLPRDPPSTYSIVVDGANVGYFKQNFPGAPKHIDYNQVDALITRLREDGHNPLLVLHARHVSPETVPVSSRDIIRRWRGEGRLLLTPPRWNDDWFWLYVAVTQDIRVVTNDEMRDHHFSMLSPRYFTLPWYHSTVSSRSDHRMVNRCLRG